MIKDSGKTILDNKLTEKQTYYLLGVLQFVVGIIGYFTVKIRVQLLGFIFLAISFLKTVNKQPKGQNEKFDRALNLFQLDQLRKNIGIAQVEYITVCFQIGLKLINLKL